MTPKARSVYRCTECGHAHAKWVGKCEGCGAWNSVAEEPETASRPDGKPSRRQFTPGDSVPIPLGDIADAKLVRWQTGIEEFDFVLGGGLVPGSLILIGGEPGIGKSTLLLQAVARLEASGRRTLYVSGEESPEQVRLRAIRMEEPTAEVHVLGETRLEAILTAASRMQAEVIVLDSIQTVYAEVLEGAPGSVGQVRECASML
ncbi:MAG TPA: ATPase domain-containing protein, partial [Gemmatimonadales bacterium]